MNRQLFVIIMFTAHVFQTFTGDMLYGKGLKSREMKAFIHCAVLIIGSGAMFLLYINHCNTKVNIAVFLTVNLLMLAVLYEGSLTSKIYYVVFYAACIYISEIIGLYLFKCLYGSELVITDEMLICLIVFTKALLFAVTKLCASIINRSGCPIPKRYFAVMTITTILTLMILYMTDIFFIGLHMEKINYIIIVLGAAGFLMMNVFVFCLVSSYLKDQEVLNTEKLRSKELNMRLKYYEAAEERYKGQQVLIHNMRKHLNMLRSYVLSDGGSGEVLEYMDKLESNISGLSVRHICNNKFLNVVLNEKLSAASREGIKFTYNIETDKINTIEDVDVCNLFANICDNAIESCVRSEKKQIDLRIYTINDDSFLFIVMTNSCDSEPVVKSGSLVTSKADSGDHGYGFKSVEGIIHKYSGDIFYEFSPELKEFKLIIYVSLV